MQVFKPKNGRWRSLPSGAKQLPAMLLVLLLPGGAEVTVAAEELADSVGLFESERSAVRRFYDLPWSELKFSRLEQLYDEWERQLGQVDFASLGQPGRIDYRLLAHELRHQRIRLFRDREVLGRLEKLLPLRKEIQSLESARWRLEKLDLPVTATLLARIPGEIKQVRERIVAQEKKATEKRTENQEEPKDIPRVTRETARRAAQVVTEIRGTLKTWFSFYDGFQPDFAWWVKKPYEEAAKALEDYAKFLREEIAGLKGGDDEPLLGEPIGRKALLEDLRKEVIAYSPEELIAIGEREFAWCERQMSTVAGELGMPDWKQALARVKGLYVSPGAQDELVAEYGRTAIQFVKARDLVTIPSLCEETWRVTMLSPDTQKTIPYAAYGGQSILVAYPREDMKHDDKLMAMRGNNRHFTRIVTAHELVPGHHLQAFMAARHRSYRSIFSTPFFVEGWPLHWEMLLWDLGYGGSAEDRLGMLFWRMHRSARIVLSLKFHLEQITPAEMVDFLVQRVGHERFGAKSEVRRFIGDDYSALYQCGYMIGGLQLRALYHEVVRSGKMDARTFHDAVLRENAIPIELVRAALLELPMSREQEASWKFADVLAKPSPE